MIPIEEFRTSAAMPRDATSKYPCRRYARILSSSSCAEAETHDRKLGPSSGPGAIAQIRELAAGRTDRHVAGCPNAEGYRSARGHVFTPARVAWLRTKHQITAGAKTEAPTPTHPAQRVGAGIPPGPRLTRSI